MSALKGNLQIYSPGIMFCRRGIPVGKKTPHLSLRSDTLWGHEYADNNVDDIVIFIIRIVKQFIFLSHYGSWYFFHSNDLKKKTKKTENTKSSKVKNNVYPKNHNENN